MQKKEITIILFISKLIRATLISWSSLTYLQIIYKLFHIKISVSCAYKYATKTNTLA